MALRRNLMKKPEDSKNEINKLQSPIFLEENEQSEELNNLLRAVTNLYEQYQHQGRFPSELVLEAMEVVLSHKRDIYLEKSSAKQYPLMPKIEDMMRDMENRFKDLILKTVTEDVQNVEQEWDIVDQKKKEYRQKGIRLRIYQRYPTSVMTYFGPVRYQRMVLRPSFDEDKRLLKEAGEDGYICNSQENCDHKRDFIKVDEQRQYNARL
jgi:hypothetical protein